MFFGHLVFCEVIEYNSGNQVLVRVLVDPFSQFATGCGVTVSAFTDEILLVA
jgi:hypothetical protein